MRLYLNATSKFKIGYIPDWLRVAYEEDDKKFELTLDVQGEIEHSEEMLNCRCKGELVPWTLYDCDTEKTIDLCSPTCKQEILDKFSDGKVAEIICNADSYTVGLFPVDSENEEILEQIKSDEFFDCEGVFDSHIEARVQCSFKFTPELNF